LELLKSSEKNAEKLTQLCWTSPSAFSAQPVSHISAAKYKVENVRFVKFHFPISLKNVFSNQFYKNKNRFLYVLEITFRNMGQKITNVTKSLQNNTILRSVLTYLV
jgi:hypothetical protein